MKIYGMVYSFTNKKVQIFNPNFVKKYKNQYKIIYKNKISPIQSELIVNGNNTDKLTIKLLSFLDIPDNIFKGCNSLLQFYKIKNNKTNLTGYKEIIKSDFEMSKMIYKIVPKEKKIKIFGENFVDKNKDKCKIIYNNNIFPLKEYFSIEELEKKSENKLELYLIEKEIIPDKSYMFDDCKLLEELSFLYDRS